MRLMVHRFHSPLYLRLVHAWICLTMLLTLFMAISSAQATARPTISQAAHQKLSAVQELIHQAKWADAEPLLEEFVRNFANEPHALAQGWQMRGYLFHETGRHAQALEAFDQILALDDLDNELRQQVLYNSAQLLVQAKRSVEAVNRIESWMQGAGTLSPEQRVRVAWIYFGSDRYQAAAQHLETAILEEDTPEDAWIEMLVAALQYDEQLKPLTRWLPRLIARNPQDNRYWLQLAGVYQRLGDSRHAAAVLSAGYHQGMFQASEDVIRLARFYFEAGVPYKGARLLETALDDGRVRPNEEHQELLSNAWLQARETRRAADALGQMARSSGDCKIHLRAGRLLMQVEDWSGAREHLEPASHERCGRARTEALLLVGMAAYHEGRLEEAGAAFALARENPEQRRQAENWLEVLRRTQGRS